MAPPRDGGRLPGVERGLGAGQTDGRHRGGEVDRGSEGDDGEVEVCGGLVVAGVRGDGRDVVPVCHVVASVMLAQENLDFGVSKGLGFQHNMEKALVASRRVLPRLCKNLCTSSLLNSNLDSVHGVSAGAVGRC